MPKYWFRCGLAALMVWCAFAIFNTASATTYYVRTDGGTATQCNGTANAPVSAAPNCAFVHPFFALSPGNGVSNYTPKSVLKPGDTLVIGTGSYMMGYGVPGVPDNNACYQPATWGCAIAGIPSGTDAAHPTTITGDCSAPPQLWATQRNGSIFDIENKHDIKIACLELTDHANCIDSYQPKSNTGGVTACSKGSYPYGAWGANALYVAGMTDLTLDQLNIHGFADYGVMAGKLAGNTTVTDVTIQANGWGGWNGDLGGNTGQWSNSGTLSFTDLKILWNGCSEAYPSTTIVGCWGQNEGGYGDGFAGSQTGGKWIFENSQFSHNAQDGLDLLYADGTGSIFIDSAYAFSNAGNGIKTNGNATLQNSVIDGYCNNWQGFPIYGDGSNGVAGTMCRADGTAVVMEVSGPNQSVTVAYNTITGNGDTLFVGGSPDHQGYAPNSTNVTTFSNNILLGQTSVIPRDDGGYTALDWYSDGTYNGKNVYTNNVVWHMKNNGCPSGSICKDPLLKNETLTGFDADLLSGSPAIHAAKGAAPTMDFNDFARVTPTSIGAIEYGSTGGGGGAPPPPIVPPRAPGHPGCKWRFCNRIMGGAGEQAYPSSGTYRAPVPYAAPAKPYTPRTPYGATVNDKF